MKTKSINIFEDGKLSRGVKAKLLSKNKNRATISFYDDFEEKQREETFKKHRRGTYCLSDGNFYYYTEMDTPEYAESVKEYITEDYWKFLFGGEL
jgi:hypothetical protein